MSKKFGKKIIKLFLIFFSIIFLALIFGLISGISIKELNSDFVQIKQLYIKLDKKLILKIQNLHFFKEKNTTNATDELLKLSDFSQKILFFFKEIDIKELSYDNKKLSLLFKDDIFYIDTDEITLNSNFEIKNKDIFSNINQLLIKDYNITFVGNGITNFHEDKYNLKGKFSAHEINGSVEINADKNIVEFVVKDANATSISNFLKNLNKNVKLDRDLYTWLRQITASYYEVSNFSAKLDLKTQKIYDLKGDGFGKNIKIYFHKALKPVEIKYSKFTFKDDILYFIPEIITYEDKNLDGSLVKVNNVIGLKSSVEVDLKTNSYFDESIKEILDAFGIKIPLTQKSGQLKSNLKLKIFLNPFKVKVNGDFDLKDANILIRNNEFYSKSALFWINNDEVKIKNANLKSEIFNLETNGSINLNTNRAEFKTFFKNICISKCEVLNIQNQNYDLFFKFAKDTELSIPKLNFKAIFGDEVSVFVNDIKDFRQYSTLMRDLNISNANLKMTIQNNNNTNIYVNECEFDLGLKKISGEIYNKDNFFVRISDEITGGSVANLIGFSVKNNVLDLSLNNLMVEIQGDDKEFDRRINIKANNSALFMKDLNKTLNFNEFNATLYKGSLDFNALMNKGFLRINKNPSSMKILGRDIKADFVNSLLGLNAFSEGNFSIQLIGENKKNFKALINANKTYLQNYQFHQNLFAFLDTIPSLAMFKVPDFNNKGFNVKNGVMSIQRNENILNISGFSLESSNSDIIGKGKIDLDNKNIDMIIEIRLLKDATSIIDKIPLVNYIILGKDKKISTTIKVSGTTDNPKFQSEIISDILFTPYNLIKNTLQLPFNLFN